ncbi:hypothetical protein ACW9UR_13360 [Halovulum sp. GXIMD14794]
MFRAEYFQAETYIELTTRLPRQKSRVAASMFVLSVFAALLSLCLLVLGEWGAAALAVVCAIAFYQFERLARRAARAELSAGADLAERSAQRRAEQEAALDARVAEAKASGAFDRFGPDNGSST